MPTRARILINDGCYHVVSRGNQKQKVFLENKDYIICIKMMKKFKKRYNFKLYGFCLMPNHIHFLGQSEKQETLSKFMQCFLRAYTGYFNAKYKKVGHLWQGRFKSNVILKDKYLIDCINYVEFNPVRANLVKTAGEYKWSSYKERRFCVNTEEKILDDITA